MTPRRSLQLVLFTKTAASLEQLHAAREASDQGFMVRKAMLLQSLMRSAPDEWMVDSDPRDPYPGITHIPTGYRFHAPQRIIPPQLLEPAMGHALARAQGLEKAADDRQAKADLTGYLAGLAGLTAPHVALPFLARDRNPAQSAPLVNKIQRWLTMGGDDYRPHAGSPSDAHAEPSRYSVIRSSGVEGVPDQVIKRPRWMAKVHASEKAHPGIWAHEAGHAAQIRGMQKGKLLDRLLFKGRTSPLPGIASGTSGLASMFARDRDQSAILSTAAAGFMAPDLLSELDASRRGYKMLRRFGANRGTAARAFSGTPSYAAVALAPLLVHAVRSRMGSFDK